jgi:molecular chaperone GrpE
LVENSEATSPDEEPKTSKTEHKSIKALRKELDEEKENAAKYLENWQRSEADLSNYKKRAEQEKNEMSNFANSTLILSLLPVMDDLERAFDSLSPDLQEANWIDGFKLIHRKLQSIMESQGLTLIEAAGQPFDPSLHEAVSQAEGPEGIVVNEVQKGYKLKDKVLRPSMVIVGNGEG